MLQALILEDDSSSLKLLSELVENEGYAVQGAECLKEARDSLRRVDPDVVLLDLKLPDGNGLDLLAELDEIPSCPEVVIMTGHATVRTAVEALRGGVTDYLSKPVDVDRLKTILANIVRTRELQEEISTLREELRGLGRFGSLVGSSPAMQRVYNLIGKVAPTSATVLITGESGTGKEVAAETIHRLSKRRRRSFLPLNCGAIAPNLIESELFGHARGSFTGATKAHKGYFERAEGGTIFLDEIAEMPIELQVKLLRVLETSTISPIGSDHPIKVSARVLAATNRDPEEAVREGTLREDLFYRLQVFPIEMPPLRDREGDVDQLAGHFLRQLCSEYDTEKTLSEDALETLRQHRWPGNVRELKNVLNRAFIVAGKEITAASLPPLKDSGGAGASKDAVVVDGDTVTVKVGRTTLARTEKGLILAALEEFDGDKKQAAKSLGISVRTLYNRLKEYRDDTE